MIPIDSPQSYALVFIIAVICGGLGGFVFELLQTRGGYGDNAGKIEMPKRYGNKPSYWDLGWVASVIIGAVTAVAILYFFPPELTITNNGQPVVYFDVVQLVALSLISGSAGGSFLGAMQARTLARLNEQKAQKVKATAAEKVEQVGKAAEAGTENAVRSALANVRPQLEQIIQGNREAALHTGTASGGDSTGQNGGSQATAPLASSLGLDEALAKIARETSNSFHSRMQEEVVSAKKTISNADDLDKLDG